MDVMATPGVLVTSDAATITFLAALNDAVPPALKFIIRTLDDHNIFIAADKVKYVQGRLADRLLDTTFDDDDVADVDGGAGKT